MSNELLIVIVNINGNTFRAVYTSLSSRNKRLYQVGETKFKNRIHSIRHSVITKLGNYKLRPTVAHMSEI